MSATMTLRVECHVVSEEHGVWCGDCLLPSGHRRRFVIVASGSLTPLHRFAVFVCETCDGVFKEDMP